MMKKSFLFLLTLCMTLPFLLSGCGESDAGRLERATRVVRERPDSAYALLRDIDYARLGSDSLRARYIVTRARANVGIGRSLITDTLLGKAAKYYLSVGDTVNWIIASQLESGHDYFKGDADSAVKRLEDVVGKTDNPELKWDCYVHLLEMYLMIQRYPEAYGCADWLQRHTDVPEETLKFGVAKGASLYYSGGRAQAALTVCDSLIASGVVAKCPPEVAKEFYCEYAAILDGAGQSQKAIAVLDSVYSGNDSIDIVEEVNVDVSKAEFYANSGDMASARALLDSINHEATKSVFEVYACIGILKAAIQYRETGRLPSEMMRRVVKTLHRSYWLSQYDRQTAMENVIELNDDNYELKLQRQRLWLLVIGIAFLVAAGCAAVYVIMRRRRQRVVEAEERAETLALMLKEAQRVEDSGSVSSDSDRLKALLLRQLGIFKMFAAAPSQQNRDALRKISSVGREGMALESIVDWPQFYAMIDSLYDGFHQRLVQRYPGLFNDKEQQIIVLLKAGFSTKETGVLTEQTSATIYTRKSVIRKKLGNPENGDIVALLNSELYPSSGHLDS